MSKHDKALATVFSWAGTACLIMVFLVQDPHKETLLAISVWGNCIMSVLFRVKASLHQLDLASIMMKTVNKTETDSAARKIEELKAEVYLLKKLAGI